VVAITPREGLTEDYLSVDISRAAVRRRDRFTARLSEQEGRLTASLLARESA
jgi:hypothetical protein